jgi:hypothetical protein
LSDVTYARAFAANEFPDEDHAETDLYVLEKSYKDVRSRKLYEAASLDASS